MFPPSYKELTEEWMCTNSNHSNYEEPFENSGVYAICVKIGERYELFYIGTTENLAYRLQCHEKKRDLLKVFRYDELYCFYKPVFDKRMRVQLERDMIELFLPRLNRQYNYEHEYHG